MAFGSFDFSDLIVKLGISEGKKRRATQKADRRKKRGEGAAQSEGEAKRRADKQDKLSSIRTQFGATSGTQRGKLGEPTTGRRRLTI